MNEFDGASMKKIGQGEDAEIFTLDGRRVLKLFFPHHRDLAEPEADITRRVQQVGLPAPQVNRTVEWDGRRGILFDGFDEGQTLRRWVRTNPWMFFQAARTVAELQAAIHTRSVSSLPSQRAELARQIQEAAVLSAGMKDAALAALERLPDGHAVCHNDLHLNNIIVTSQRSVVIDWVLAAHGHPLSDVARTCLMLRLGVLPANPLASAALRVMRAAFERAYLAGYFQLRPGSIEAVRAWELPVAAALVSRRTIPMQRDQLLAVVAQHLNGRS